MIFFVSFRWHCETCCLKIWKLENNSDDAHWNVWTNIKTLYAQNNIFKKRVPNMRFWIIYILIQISFLGTALGRFIQCFFFNFSSSVNHCGRHFCSANGSFSITYIILSFLLQSYKIAELQPCISDHCESLIN